MKTAAAYSISFKTCSDKRNQLTPSNEEEDPFSELVCGIRHHNGCVEITALHKHPEEIGHHKVIIDCCYETTPGL